MYVADSAMDLSLVGRVIPCVRVCVRARASVCIIVSDIDTSVVRRPLPDLGFCIAKKKKLVTASFYDNFLHASQIFRS